MKVPLPTTKNSLSSHLFSSIFLQLRTFFSFNLKKVSRFRDNHFFLSRQLSARADFWQIVDHLTLPSQGNLNSDIYNGHSRRRASHPGIYRPGAGRTCPIIFYPRLCVPVAPQWLVRYSDTTIESAPIIRCRTSAWGMSIVV